MISEFRRGERCNPGVASWLASLSPGDIYLSVLTIGEIRKGIENIRRRDRRASESLESWLDDIVAMHADRILPVDQAVAEEWGRLNVPDPLPAIDGLLAATAAVHGLTLATGNIKDVVRSGVDCMNPFIRTKAP